MTSNIIQVYILLIFYNINKHIKLLFLKPNRVASIKANIGQNFYSLFPNILVYKYCNFFIDFSPTLPK